MRGRRKYGEYIFIENLNFITYYVVVVPKMRLLKFSRYFNWYFLSLNKEVEIPSHKIKFPRFYFSIVAIHNILSFSPFPLILFSCYTNKSMMFLRLIDLWHWYSTYWNSSLKSLADNQLKKSLYHPKSSPITSTSFPLLILSHFSSHAFWGYLLKPLMNMKVKMHSQVSSLLCSVFLWAINFCLVAVLQCSAILPWLSSIHVYKE